MVYGYARAGSAPARQGTERVPASPQMALSNTQGRATQPGDQAGGGGLAGTVLAGKYEFVRLLGEGGMGAVYEARNLSTFKRVAVKLLLSSDLAQNKEMVRRFFREAQASSVVESDHIVTIFDSGTDQATGYPFMVMEMLQGEDLEHTLARLGPLPPATVAKVALQSAAGLAKAHEHGIIHRDIKPANIYLTRRDSGDLLVKLLDFGIAKVKMENFQDTSAGLTRDGTMLGTPLYMSPEQASAKTGEIDPSSDVWSIGVVMYEAISGRLPFEHAQSLGQLMVAIITEDIPLLQDKAPWCPPELAEIVHRAMSRDLSQRFKNAAELRNALNQIVPEGARLTPDLMVPLPEEFRTRVAPRLQLSDTGILHATTRTGLSFDHEEPLPRRKSSNNTVVLAATLAGATIMLGGAGIAAWKLTSSPAPEPAHSAAVLAAPVPAREEARAEPKTATYRLKVSPKGATVTVDDDPVEVVGGSIEITGAPGATRTVRLSHDGQQKEQLVAITEAGLMPPMLSIAPEQKAEPAPAPAAAAARPRPKSGASRPAAPKAGSTTPSPAAAPAQARTDTSEFE